MHDTVATQTLVNYLSTPQSRKKKKTTTTTIATYEEKKEGKQTKEEQEEKNDDSCKINGLTSRVNNHKTSHCVSEVAHKLLYKRRNQR